MKILVDKALRIKKKMPKIIKSIKETENNEKNSYFNLGRNPMEIVHGPLKKKKKNNFFKGFGIDKKTKEFCCYVFSLLLNCTDLNSMGDIFKKIKYNRSSCTNFEFCIYRKIGFKIKKIHLLIINRIQLIIPKIKAFLI
jgi:hypothetical protein